MQELMKISEPAKMSLVQAALEEAGYGVEITTELADPWSNITTFVVWIENAADKGAARQIASEALNNTAVAFGQGVSRVDPMLESRGKCLHCGYSLQGQVVDGKCPECGHPYRIVSTRKCPVCSEIVPGNFEICWNCGGEMPELP